MKKLAIIGLVLATAGATLAGQRAVNAYKTSKISTRSVLVSCNDEREPVISRLENTTAIVVTCR